jgi:hypothetical protein
MDFMDEKYMDYQVLFNIAILALGSLGGFILRAIWSNIKDLQLDHKSHSCKLSAIEILVAGKYVTKNELNKLIDNLSNNLSNKLDKIESKLDTKYPMRKPND